MVLEKKSYGIYLTAAVITAMLLFMLGSLVKIVNGVNSGSSVEMAKKERLREQEQQK